MQKLKNLPNWVCHKNKIPIDPKTGKNAKSNDRHTWGTYEQAKSLMESDSSISGLGFMFTNSPYVGIDIDHCIINGELSQMANKIINTVNSYTEVSPSGTGIHIICEGKLEGVGRKNSTLGLEMYETGRYFTVTENTLKDYKTVQKRQDEIQALYTKYFNTPKKTTASASKKQTVLYLDDDKLIELAGKSKNSDKFIALYNGDWQTYYNSQSEADIAFCNMLAFWTGRDEQQMDRIFRTSGLMRDKWEEKHGINTYGDITITKAIDSCEKVYEPSTNRDVVVDAQPSEQQSTEKQPQSSTSSVSTSTSPATKGMIQPGTLDRFHKFNKQGEIAGIFDIRIAKHIIENENLMMIGDIMYLYNNGVYKEDKRGRVLKDKIKKLIYEQYQTAYNINKVYDLITLEPALQKGFNDLNKYPDTWINFKNGMLDVTTMKLLPHSPSYYSMNQIPHEYKSLTKEDMKKFPHSQHFLETSLNVEDIDTVFQYMGLCMTTITKYQIFLLFLGEGDNGKSILIDIFNAVIGENNTSSLSMDKLAQRFFPAQLLFKLMSTCADISKTSIEDDSELKKIIGGDMIQAEFKGQDSFSFRPYAKLLFSANRFPHVDDKSNGFKRRLRVIKMNKNIKEKDIDLKDKILKELDFWVYMAVQGLRKALEQKAIYESETSKKERENVYKNGDSVYAFISDCLMPQEGHNIKRADMFREYEKYCLYHERTRVSKKTFFDEMAAKGIIVKRINSEGYVYKDYAFLIWKDEEDIFPSKE